MRSKPGEVREFGGPRAIELWSTSQDSLANALPGKSVISGALLAKTLAAAAAGRYDVASELARELERTESMRRDAIPLAKGVFDVREVEEVVAPR